MGRNQFFRFKQFTVFQDRCAMKVGTDGVLLGAWATVPQNLCHCDAPYRILDIGTGTGLVALMAAQRSPDSFVYGIEIDPDAASQARENFNSSPWKERMASITGDIIATLPENTYNEVFVNIYSGGFITDNQSKVNQNIQSSKKTAEGFPTEKSTDYSHPDEKPKFNSILCNPPYFRESLTCPSETRTIARHTATLDFDNLAHIASALLSDQGTFSVILPFEALEDFLRSCSSHRLSLSRRTDVLTKPDSAPKRVLLEFTKTQTGLGPTNEHSRPATEASTLVIGSEEYQNLVKDFYLNL